MSFYQFAKHALVPGSLGLLLLGFGFGILALQFARTARIGKFLLGILLAGYWMMSMPIGAWLLGWTVSAGYSPIENSSTLANVQAIVILDGGTRRYNRDGIEFMVVERASAVRALEAIRLYRVHKPSLVLVTGDAYPGGKPKGDAIRTLLLAAGVPASSVVVESASHDTRESAANVSALLGARGLDRVALVTSSVHMRRAVRNFAAAGMQAVPAPAPIATPGHFAWWPSDTALNRSKEAWYEIFGLLRDLLL